MIFYFPQRLCHHSSNNVPRPPSLPLLGIGPFNPFDLARAPTTGQPAVPRSQDSSCQCWNTPLLCARRLGIYIYCKLCWLLSQISCSNLTKFAVECRRMKWLGCGLWPGWMAEEGRGEMDCTLDVKFIKVGISHVTVSD